MADLGDVVALIKDLRPLFGAQTACATVDNGAHAHDATSYPTSSPVPRSRQRSMTADGGQAREPRRYLIAAAHHKNNPAPGFFPPDVGHFIIRARCVSAVTAVGKVGRGCTAPVSACHLMSG
ncbi:hypothetical protein [Streptacidiphilus sp. PAMC 29251]